MPSESQHHSWVARDAAFADALPIPVHHIVVASQRTEREAISKPKTHSSEARPGEPLLRSEFLCGGGRKATLQIASASAQTDLLTKGLTNCGWSSGSGYPHA
jgi:hypothetical protein